VTADIDELAEAFATISAHFQFWVCPDHRGRVEWTGKVATCLECGRTNQPEISTDLTPFGIVYRERPGRWVALCSHCEPCTTAKSIHWGIAFTAAFMHASEHADCLASCDDDCELGSIHCEWAHLPSHKPGWHSQEDCPHR